MADIPPMPPLLEPPPRPAARQRPHGTWAGIGISLGFGAVLDAALDGPPGLGFLLVAAAAAAGLIATTRPRPAALPFFGAGLVLMAFVVVRASSAIVALDTFGALCLFAAGASFAREGWPAAATVRGYLARMVAVIGGLPHGFAALTPPIVRSGGGAAVLRRIPATVLICVPVVGVLAILLGTADPVFGHLLTSPVQGVNPVSFPVHAFEIGVGALAFAALAARARRPVILGPLESTIDLGPTSAGGAWMPLLVSVDLLFAVFVAVQFATFFGGRTRVLTQEGLTYAQYARTGFWQLLAATIITGGVIAFAWMAGGRERTRLTTFRWLSGALVLLDLVVLVSAFRRLTLYEDTFGWTWPRLAVHATILAVGALLLCGLAGVIRGRVAWLPTAAVGVAVVTLIGLSAVNPDAFIAQRNLERFQRTGDLDGWELRNLSADAVPVLVEALPTLEPCARAEVSALLAQTAADAGRFGWASWNLGRERAADAVATLGEPGPVAVPAGCG